jgi:hypothetical protein
LSLAFPKALPICKKKKGVIMPSVSLRGARDIDLGSVIIVTHIWPRKKVEIGL